MILFWKKNEFQEIALHGLLTAAHAAPMSRFLECVNQLQEPTMEAVSCRTRLVILCEIRSGWIIMLSTCISTGLTPVSELLQGLNLCCWCLPVPWLQGIELALWRLLTVILSTNTHAHSQGQSVCVYACTHVGVHACKEIEAQTGRYLFNSSRSGNYSKCFQFTC